MVSHGYYVIAPDLPGRGNSDYLSDPRGYSIECNIADLTALLHQLQITKFDFFKCFFRWYFGYNACQPTTKQDSQTSFIRYWR